MQKFEIRCARQKSSCVVVAFCGGLPVKDFHSDSSTRSRTLLWLFIIVSTLGTDLTVTSYSRVSRIENLKKPYMRHILSPLAFLVIVMLELLLVSGRHFSIVGNVLHENCLTFT